MQSFHALSRRSPLLLAAALRRHAAGRLLLSAPVALAEVPSRGKAHTRKKHRANLLEKFMKDQSKKKDRRVVDVWLNMGVRDLARALQLPSDDVFELVLGIEKADYLEDDRQPIMEPEVFEAIAKKLLIHVKFVADPAKASADKHVENLDVVVTPPKPEDLQPRPPVVAIMGRRYCFS
jgi:hypothetical protein